VRVQKWEQRQRRCGRDQARAGTDRAHPRRDLRRLADGDLGSLVPRNWDAVPLGANVDVNGCGYPQFPFFYEWAKLGHANLGIQPEPRFEPDLLQSHFHPLT
jgi:hypothetical protein